MYAPMQESMFSVLDSTNSIRIKEKVSVIEAASAIIGQEIEMANRYSVHDRSTGAQLFYAVEQTGCLARQLKQLCSDCAPWSVDILAGGPGGMAPAVKMERPFSCTCCCFNRPTVQILNANSAETMGYVTDPCTFCNYNFYVRDAGGRNIIAAEGGCCQWGICCPCPCGPCSEVNFDLTDPQSGTNIGRLQKKVPGILKFFLAPDVDNYTVEFTNPQGWSAQKKMLAIALSIFMDFRLFSENPNDDEGGLIGAMSGDGYQ